MSGFLTIDLSKLPAPQVIETVEYEVLLAEMKAQAVTLVPDLAPFLDLESEPAAILLQVCAYYRALDRAAFNDGARACMLGLASGTDLDQLAAYWGVSRKVTQEADASVSPAIPEILETDDAFRARAQTSLEGFSTAGPRGAYVFHALSADGAVKDASATSPAAGEVVVSVLSHEGNGAPLNAVLMAVEAALNDEDVRPLTDLLTVQGATVIEYAVEAELVLYEGPVEDEVTAAAQAAIEGHVAARHRLGHDITLSGIYAALHQAGVQKVTLTSPAADILVDDNEAAFCTGVTLTSGGRDV